MKVCRNADAGDSFQKMLVRHNYEFQAQLLFREVDTDASGGIDAAELKRLGDAMNLGWSKHDAKEVLTELDTDGNGEIDFDEFFNWYCSQRSVQKDKTGAFSSQLRLMLRAHGVEQRQVLITGFPFKATEGGVERFFGRCGNVTHVRMLPWAKTGKPSGRFVLEFSDVDGAKAALLMHKKKMGPRDLGVFRINVGDSEDTMAMDKAVHPAILGPNGAFLQAKENESGGRIFLRHNETHGWVTIKGTPKEREAAKRLIVEATQGGVATETVTVGAECKQALLARKGRAMRQIQLVSGAKLHIAQTAADARSSFGVKKAQVSQQSSAILQVTGMQTQRIAAKAKVEELARTYTEVTHAMPTKFHGNLKGKGAVVVQRIEEETTCAVTFSNEDGGSVSLAGSQAACDEAWHLIQHLKKVLPQTLSKLRAGVAAGDLASRPDLEGTVEAHQVWGLAADEAVWVWKNKQED